MKRIIIIKLGALGDVVRTLPIAKAIKEKYPDSEITWVTKKNALDIVKTSPYIDRVLNISSEISENFDILYNFDIDNEATKIAKKINASDRLGFCSDGGYPSAFNPASEYYLNTLFDDELKKSNKKTYQKMMFEAAELRYKKQHHEIYFSDKDKQYAEEFIKENNLDKKRIIGIHLGASSRWPSKKWHKENLKEFIIKAKNKGYDIILFGGPNEKKEHEDIFNELNRKGIKIHRNNPDNSVTEFASLVNICNSLVCSDSLALHVSLALKKPTVGLFFVTSPHEVEDYGLLNKIVSPNLYEFFPEKMDLYSEELTKSISADEVLEAVEETLNSSKDSIRVVNAIAKHPIEKKFLVIKRSNEEIHNEKWAFPGGIVKEGETLHEALRRELKEETGLELKKIIKKISNYSYERPSGEKTFGTSYLVEVSDDYVSSNSEVKDFKWVTMDEFMNMDFIEGLDEEVTDAFVKNV